jgi:imidazole glycerol-phosphate synthase subunit HisH
LKNILIIKYSNSGNIGSVKNAIEKNLDKSLKNKFNIKSSFKKKEILKADALVLPGVGNNKNIIDFLNKNKLNDVIIKFYKSNKPILAICAGFQILYEYSKEGNVKCLGILKGKVLKIKENLNLKVPSYGWHETKRFRKSKFINKIEFFYYIHSYYVKTRSNIIMKYSYARKNIPSLVFKKKLIGCQFHPELSGKSGDKIIQLFLKKIK